VSTPPPTTATMGRTTCAQAGSQKKLQVRTLTQSTIVCPAQLVKYVLIQKPAPFAPMVIIARP
jgi:hypothetical protein